MSAVRLTKATRHFPGMNRPAVNEVSLEVADGEFLVLVGPSGCGKSTLLRMVAGLETVDSGSISIGDREVTNLAPKDRNIAMVFQSYALYPHMTVAENIGFNLKINNVDKAEIKQRVEETARMLDLSELLERKPAKLSGGQRQRVAMGRAIVRKPEVFLMDEPLSNLDAKLRVQTRTQVAELQRQLGITTVYVTHDQVEAMTMGTRIAVLKDGVLQQVAPPQELFSHPVNVFVAGFIGSPAMNIVSAHVEDHGVRLGGALVPVDQSTIDIARSRGLSEVTFGFRPEDVRVSGSDGFNMLIDVVEVTGADAYCYGTVDTAHGSQNVIARADGRTPPRRGDTIHLTIAGGHAHVFDPNTGARIGN